MLEKTERAIKNGQSRDTGNIGYLRHRMKINKTKHNIENLNNEHIRPHQQQGKEPVTTKCFKNIYHMWNNSKSFN